MSLRDNLKTVKTVREKVTEIKGLGNVLFIEPPQKELKAAADMFLKFDLITKRGRKGMKQESKLDSKKSDADAYNRQLVLMTTYDPITREKAFEGADDFDSLFAPDSQTGIPRNGSELKEALIKGAMTVINPKALTKGELDAKKKSL